MRYGRDYDRGYDADLGRGPETRWTGRSYRTPGGGRPRGYDASYGAGDSTRRGAWDARPSGGGYDRPYRDGGYDAGYRPRGGYDSGFRTRGGYDRPYRDFGRGYDRGYRGTGGMMRGGGRVLSDPWGPYSSFRQAQRRLSSEERPWPHRYFTDHGTDSGSY